MRINKSHCIRSKRWDCIIFQFEFNCNRWIISVLFMYFEWKRVWSRTKKRIKKKKKKSLSLMFRRLVRLNQNKNSILFLKYNSVYNIFSGLWDLFLVVYSEFWSWDCGSGSLLKWWFKGFESIKSSLGAWITRIFGIVSI